MNIFFDMDRTLLGLDETLRPGAADVLGELHRDGHTVYVWSGNRSSRAELRDEIRRHGLDRVVADCFLKPLYNYAQATRDAGLPVIPDLVVDDFPEVPRALGGIWVPPYRFLLHSEDDDAMRRVYTIVMDYVRDGHSADERFCRPPAPPGV